MIEQGKIVISLTGRDAGRFYVVVAQESDMVTIVDGKVRKLASPKRKNIKHLSVTNKGINYSDITSDRYLRGILEPMNQSKNIHNKMGGK